MVLRVELKHEVEWVQSLCWVYCDGCGQKWFRCMPRILWNSYQWKHILNVMTSYKSCFPHGPQWKRFLAKYGFLKSASSSDYRALLGKHIMTDWEHWDPDVCGWQYDDGEVRANDDGDRCNRKLRFINGDDSDGFLSLIFITEMSDLQNES